MNVALALALLIGSAANDAQAEFQAVLARYRKVDFVSGDFAQTICSEELGYCQSLSGKFWLGRPNRFRFEVTDPEKQIIVGDGDHTWFFWPDSNLVRKLPGSTNPFFEALLGDSSSIFQAESIAADLDRTTLTLAPLDSLSGIQSVKLHLKPGAHTIVGVEIDDGFGGASKYELTNTHLNTRPPGSTFQFIPPAGAVIEE